MPSLKYEVAKRAVSLVKDREIIYEDRMDDRTNLPELETLKSKAESLE